MSIIPKQYFLFILVISFQGIILNTKLQVNVDPTYEELIVRDNIFEFNNSAQFKVIELECRISKFVINLNSKASKIITKIEVKDSDYNNIFIFNQDKIYPTGKGQIFKSDLLSVPSKSQGVKSFIYIYLDEDKIIGATPTTPSVKLQLFLLDFSINQFFEVFTYDPTKSLSLAIPVASFQQNTEVTIILDVGKYGLEKFCESSLTKTVQKLAPCVEKIVETGNDKYYGIIYLPIPNITLTARFLSKEASNVYINDLKAESISSDSEMLHFKKESYQNLILLTISIKDEEKKSFYEYQAFLKEPPTLLELKNENIEVINTFSLTANGRRIFCLRSGLDVNNLNIYHYSSKENILGLVSYGKIPYNISLEEMLKEYDNLSFEKNKLTQFRLNEFNSGIPAFLIIINNSEERREIEFSSLITKSSYSTRSSTILRFSDEFLIAPKSKAFFFFQNNSDLAKIHALNLAYNNNVNLLCKYSTTTIIATELLKLFTLSDTSSKSITGNYIDLSLKERESIVVEISNTSDVAIASGIIKIYQFSDANTNFLKGAFIKTMETTPKEFPISLVKDVNYRLDVKVFSISSNDRVYVKVNAMESILLTKDKSSNSALIKNSSKLTISSTILSKEAIVYILISSDLGSVNLLDTEVRTIDIASKSGILTKFFVLNSDSETSVNYKLSLRTQSQLRFSSLSYQLSYDKTALQYVSTDDIDSKPSLINETSEVFLSFNNIKKTTYVTLRLGVKVPSPSTAESSFKFNYLITSQTHSDVLRTSKNIGFELYDTKKIVVLNNDIDFKNFVIVQVIKPSDTNLKCQFNFEDNQLKSKSFIVEKGIETVRINNIKELKVIKATISCPFAYKSETHSIYVNVALVDNSYETVKLQPGIKSYKIDVTKPISSDWITVKYIDYELFLSKSHKVEYFFSFGSSSATINPINIRQNYEKEGKFPQYKLNKNQTMILVSKMTRGVTYSSVLFAVDLNTNLFADYENSMIKYRDVEDPTSSDSTSTKSTTTSTDDTSQTKSSEKSGGLRWFIIFIIVIVAFVGIVGLIFGVKYCMSQRRKTNQEHAEGFIGYKSAFEDRTY